MATEDKIAAKQAKALFGKATAGRPAEPSSTNYRDLLAQREALEAKIAEARESEVADVLAQIRQLVDDYGLQDQVKFIQTSSQKGPRAPAAIKYRDPESGNTWSGRGKPPAWIKDKDRTQFLVA